MDYIYFFATEITISLLIIAISFYSDREKRFKILSGCCLLPTAILEYPHIFLPDPLNLIDLSVHIAAGLTIFIVICNIKFIPERRRGMFGMLVVIIFIIGLEVFQIILKLTIDLGGPITLDVLEDIFVTIGGGLIGFIATELYQKYTKIYLSAQ